MSRKAAIQLREENIRRTAVLAGENPDEAIDSARGVVSRGSRKVSQKPKKQTKVESRKEKQKRKMRDKKKRSKKTVDASSRSASERSESVGRKKKKRNKKKTGNKKKTRRQKEHRSYINKNSTVVCPHCNTRIPQPGIQEHCQIEHSDQVIDHSQFKSKSYVPRTHAKGSKAIGDNKGKKMGGSWRSVPGGLPSLGKKH